MRNETKNRRKSNILFPYLFFLFEIVVIFEIAYIYTTIFGTTLPALFPLALVVIYFLRSALLRLLKVLERIRFSNYNFTTKNK